MPRCRGERWWAKRSSDHFHAVHRLPKQEPTEWLFLPSVGLGNARSSGVGVSSAKSGHRQNQSLRHVQEPNAHFPQVPTGLQRPYCRCKRPLR
ncbi:Uncharacterised protein [Vibrio cholerae]|uniref:Uncharacterized protein n=1 Tax=Vibrio cholerae TaxID=666 RepID=A0A656AXR4_VIBCL|nr:Uncharacterised protein [Vibrio cholerae]CSD49420.1 Uncharacterised protein [Vibrio cholerae]